MPTLPDRAPKEGEEPEYTATELMTSNLDVSPKSSRCALKCKYCGAERPLLSLADHEWRLSLSSYKDGDDWILQHSACQVQDGVTGDRQPFLLSWS